LRSDIFSVVQTLCAAAACPIDLGQEFSAIPCAGTRGARSFLDLAQSVPGQAGLAGSTMEGVMTSRRDEQPTYSFVEVITDVIADWVKRYRYAAGLRDDLARCGREEVARVASDLGVSPGELVRLARKGPHAADQLKKLLLALGADRKKLAPKDPGMMRDLQRVCITCGCKPQCERELAMGSAAQHYRNYCPNASSLAALFASK
jgi:hypothetical protein